MATAARADFRSTIDGPLSIYANATVPVDSADQDRTVSKLRVDLRKAPTGSAVMIQFFNNLVLMGTVTVAIAAVDGELAITPIVIPAGNQIRPNVIQTGEESAPGETATCTARVD